jgi:hypothetical protein
MGKISLLIMCFIAFSWAALAQEIVLDRQADLGQVYLNSYESAGPLPMNDLDMEFGYVLYESEINVESEDAVLELEHVRDYAVVFVDDRLQGTLTDSKKKVPLKIGPGKYRLKLFVENIGRITYGPEILDNAKGLFGSISLDREEVENWTMIPLNIKGADVAELIFDVRKPLVLPCFLKGAFNVDKAADCYLDISGWGMGEVWINGKYIGSFWEEEKQQSIQISADVLIKGKNEITVFELKNTEQKNMKITDKPVFH